MPAPVRPVTAIDDDEVVVFLIGMTFNRLRKVRAWWPIFTAMPRMLRELDADPELGLLSSRMLLDRHGPTLIQYWRSAEHLERFARAKDHEHMPAWTAFRRSAASASGDVGIWHESYVTRPGSRESIYHATPRFGFADAAARVEPVGAGQETARKRREGLAVTGPAGHA